jgi:hypothetical protein
MLKRFVLVATLCLAALMAPATAQSLFGGDWVPPPEAAQWAPGTTENLAIVRRLMPGLKGQDLERAQFTVAVDMAMLTALVGRAEAALVERRWERRFNAMYASRRVDETLNRWGITPSRTEEYMRQTGLANTAMTVMTLGIMQRERLENEIANGKNVAENRAKLRLFAERDIFGEAASNIILSRDNKYLSGLRQTIVDGGNAAAAARAKKSAPSVGQGK